MSKVYRVARQTDGGVSAGYEFYATKREAKRAVRENNAARSDHDKRGGLSLSTFDVVEFKATRAGILALLNDVASHADNG